MKIFIPFTIKDIGGVSTFANKFKLGLEKEGHEVFFEFRENYDILFLITQCPFKYLLDAKRREKKIIQRLDGCWYWSVSGWKYWLYNLKAKIIYKYFSDFLIFQSHYSKYCCEKILGKVKKDFKIIYNGVDLNLFNPVGEEFDFRNNNKQQIFITASAFRREDQIIPIIKSMEIYKNKYNKNFKLIVAGNFTGKARHIPETYKNIEYINFIGKIKNEELPKYERATDVFLFTHFNPPCPNNIIEAMACGLPICGVNDGAMSEITTPWENSKLVETTGDAFWIKRKINKLKFSDNLNYIMKNFESFKKKSREIAENKFSLDKMIKSYIIVIEKLI